MLSYIDIAFLIMSVIHIAVYAYKGFVVALLGMLRFIVIVPISYLLINVVRVYIPTSVFGDIPIQFHTVIIFLIIFVALYVVTSIILSMLQKLQRVKHMPLKRTNALLGGILGFVKSAVLIFVFSTVLGLIFDVIPKDTQFYQIIDSSIAVGYINQINPLHL